MCVEMDGQIGDPQKKLYPHNGEREYRSAHIHPVLPIRTSRILKWQGKTKPYLYLQFTRTSPETGAAYFHTLNESSDRARAGVFLTRYMVLG